MFAHRKSELCPYVTRRTTWAVTATTNNELFIIYARTHFYGPGRVITRMVRVIASYIIKGWPAAPLRDFAVARVSALGFSLGCPFASLPF